MIDLRESPAGRPETGSGRPAAYQNGDAAGGGGGASAMGNQERVGDQALSCFAYDSACGGDCECRVDPDAYLDTSKLVDVMFKELITDSMKEVRGGGLANQLQH